MALPRALRGINARPRHPEERSDERPLCAEEDSLSSSGIFPTFHPTRGERDRPRPAGPAKQLYGAAGGVIIVF